MRIGDRFGAWVVIGDAIGGDTRKIFCRCDCGREFMVRIDYLRNGRSKGCRQCSKGSTTHGDCANGTIASEYTVWHSMVSRCCRKENARFQYYGGRGIRVCDEWRGRGGYDRFLAHVGRRPSAKHTLNRIDNDGNYEPGNVEWATRSEQNRNTRRNRMVEVGGVVKCVQAWADEVGISRNTITKRLNSGWDSMSAVFGHNQ